MKIAQIKELVNAKILTDKMDMNDEVFRACGADLMSDVLRYAKEEVILVTGLTNIHTLRTVEMANIHYVLFVRDKMPTEDVIEEANEVGIQILQTQLPMYEACGILYKNGLGN